MRTIAFALVGGFYACAVSAQVAPVHTAPAQTMFVGQAQPQYAMLRTGTKVAMKTSEPLTTKGKKLRVGHRFQMEVAEPVMVDGQVVIPAGSPAIGEITDVRNKGMWGKSGRINARVLHVNANGRQIRMSGSREDWSAEPGGRRGRCEAVQADRRQAGRNIVRWVEATVLIGLMTLGAGMGVWGWIAPLLSKR